MLSECYFVLFSMFFFSLLENEQQCINMYITVDLFAVTISCRYTVNSSNTEIIFHLYYVCIGTCMKIMKIKY